MRILMLLPLALVSACTGTQGETYLGRPGSPAWFATAAPETIADYFVRRCKAYGFVPGTPQMAQCVQQEAGSTQNRNAVRMVAIAATQPRPTPNVTCTTNRLGNSLVTNCN